MTAIPVILILSCLLLLGSSRLRDAIYVVALQGWFLGLQPLIAHLHALNTGIIILGLSGIFFKGILLPLLMFKVLKDTGLEHDQKPYVPYSASLLSGVLLLALAAWLAVNLGFPKGTPLLLTTTAFMMMLVGLFLMIGRRLAIMQSLAYLVLENGIYALGLSISLEFPLTVELGILLDVFVAVFLMGNLVFHLDQEFHHTQVDGFLLSEDSSHPEESNQ